jgi:hypothetical protein
MIPNDKLDLSGFHTVSLGDGPDVLGLREQEAELVMKKNISVEPGKCCIHSHGFCTF